MGVSLSKVISSYFLSSLFISLTLLSHAEAQSGSATSTKLQFTVELETDTSSIQTWSSSEAPNLDILFFSQGLRPSASSVVQTAVSEAISIPSLNSTAIQPVYYYDRADLDKQSLNFYDAQCTERAGLDARMRRLGNTLLRIPAAAGSQEVWIAECESTFRQALGWFVRFQQWTAGINADYYYVKQ